MALKKIRKNDKVKLVAGKDKGKTGVVKEMRYPLCIVEGLNLVSHFVKANPNTNETGGVRKKEAPVHVSNVVLVDDTNEPIKVGVKIMKDGTRKRYNKKTGKEILEV